MAETKNGNGWRGYALSFAVALLLGGGFGNWRAFAEAEKVKSELERKIEKLEQKIEADSQSIIDNQLRIVEGVTRLETEIRYIKAQLDR